MSITLGKILDIPIRLHFTLILSFFLIAGSLALGYMPAEYPGQSVLTYWTIGIISAILLFVSILIHELSHSYVAQRYGLKISSIILYIFGGLAQLQEEPKNPDAEFRISLAGPASSLILGAILLPSSYLVRQSSQNIILIATLEYGGLINLLLAGFNFIPAFPMDGGRVLRAILWKKSNSILKATTTASRVGIGFSYVFMALGLVFALLGVWVTGIWFLFIGWFLKSSAESSLSSTIVSQALSNVKVSDIMTREIHTVSPEVNVEDVVKEHLTRYKHGGFPVAQNGELVGMITIHDIKKVPQEKWSITKVRDIMTTKEKLITIDRDSPATDALLTMSKNEIGRLPVVKEDRLIGILSRSDITHAIKVKSELGQ